NDHINIKARTDSFVQIQAASESSKMLPSEAAFQGRKASRHVRILILLHFLSPE
ncbi:hypothetical protein M9458_053511, partial [Cirrhinus mrigala]